jgi:hypothetical protein
MFNISGVLWVIDPLVAFTRTVLVPVSWVGLVLGEPPQAVSELRIIANIPRPSICATRRCPRHTPRSAINGTDSAIAALFPLPFGLTADAEFAVDPMVSVAEALPPAAIVAWAGAKLQVMPMGSPEQLRVTAPAAPYWEAICTATAGEVARYETLRVDVDRVSDNAGAFANTVNVITLEEEEA